MAKITDEHTDYDCLHMAVERAWYNHPASHWDYQGWINYGRYEQLRFYVNYRPCKISDFLADIQPTLSTWNGCAIAELRRGNSKYIELHILAHHHDVPKYHWIIPTPFLYRYKAGIIETKPNLTKRQLLNPLS